MVLSSAPMVYSKVLLNMTYTRSWEQDLGVTPSLPYLTTRLESPSLDAFKKTLDVALGTRV